MTTPPKIIVFASGTREGGGSGFENLVAASHGSEAVLAADIVAVVSNHEHGGVRARAECLGVPFMHFPKPYTAERYREVVRSSGAEWVALSGWLKKTVGLDPQRTFNIHPGPLHDLQGRFGGEGKYGHFVHEVVKAALDAGEVTSSAASMHFVTDEYDRGPVFFEYRVPLSRAMDADAIGKAVNEVEHQWQPRITNMVVHGEIVWDGVHPSSLVVPDGYTYLPKE
jgi:folate-dependent phosphoribosylglycinamide formyltransferase PurN